MSKETIKIQDEWRPYLEKSVQYSQEMDELKEKIEARQEELNKDEKLLDLVAQFNLVKRKGQTYTGLFWAMVSDALDEFRTMRYNQDDDIIEVLEEEVGKPVKEEPEVPAQEEKE